MAKPHEDDGLEELKLAVATLKADHKALTDRFEAHERKQNGSLDKIWAELKELTKAITTPRGPTWGVSAAITGLVGLSSALIVYTVTH